MRETFEKVHPRALALLLAAAALPITPALAQEAPASTPAPVTPPPVVSTTTAPPAASPAVSPAPRIVMMPTKEVAQPLPTPDVQPAAQPAPGPARSAARTVRAQTAPRAAVRVPVAAPEAPSVPEALVAPVPVVPPVVEPAPDTVVATPVETAPDTALPAEVANDTNNATVWPWIIAALAVVGLIGVFFARRRRTVDEDYYEDVAVDEPVYVAPVAVAPLAAAHAAVQAPVVEEVSVAPSNDAEVDAIMAGAAPTGDRPWIELGMRPVRAGTSADDAIVEFELTVGNAGTVSAQDVRISTWLFTADPAQSDNERLMITPPVNSALTALSIAPGDGKRVDTVIALPKSSVHAVSSAGHAAFLPVVGAEARYRLPDGSEGRIAASFAIGMAQGEGEALVPFPMDGAPDMQDNVEARLYGDLERS